MLSHGIPHPGDEGEALQQARTRTPRRRYCMGAITTTVVFQAARVRRLPIGEGRPRSLHQLR